MAVFKCKMCGGDLRIIEGQTVCECEYCGSRQTVPALDSEKKATLFSRANRLRAMCEFDKAYSVYESIVADFPEEAEAYWGLVLCKYGIEYVDDPKTGKKIPTCHRSSFDNVMEDGNFELVMEYADVIARPVYRAEAKEIERLRSGILEVSSKEEPYDIFICYKETDDKGDRTVDSLIAQDVYDALTEKGYRAFFSRISLEDKLGQEYEPYIFAALHSAKIMLVFGTSYDNFNAVWVKNEWSRYLSLIAKGEKKTLIPCYKDLDAYDMPQEFRKLQAQDMSKIGALQDLVRGIDKLIPKPTVESMKVAVFSGQQSVVAPLLERAFMFLEDGDWKKANEYCEKALDFEPQNGRAYLGKLMAELHVRAQEQLGNQPEPFDGFDSYQKSIRFGSNQLKLELEKYISEINDRNRQTAINREKAVSLVKGRIATLALHSVAVREDGSVVATGNNTKHQCEVSDWTDIVAVATGVAHTIGIRANGTVVATGDNTYGQCNVSDWEDIVAVAAHLGHTIGLKADGTVVAAGHNGYGQCNVSNWSNIIAVAAGMDCTIGLTSEGNVLVAGGTKTSKLPMITSWNNIVSFAVGITHWIALKKDGTLTAIGDNVCGECDVSDWTDIVAVDAVAHSVGQKTNGSVVAVGLNKNGQCNVSNWENIIAISAGQEHTLGVKLDGTVVSCGENSEGQCNVSDWKLFSSIASLESSIKRTNEIRERAAEESAKRRADEAERCKQEEALKREIRRQQIPKELEALQQRKQAAKAELANLTGLFSGRRRRELESEITNIDKQIDSLEQTLKNIII